MPRALDGDNELTLMPGACSRDTAGNDLSLFGDAAHEALFVLIIDVDVFRFAETAIAFFPLLLLTVVAAPVVVLISAALSLLI